MLQVSLLLFLRDTVLLHQEINTPEVRGYETELWTTVRVADLIEQECGVKYHPAHVWRILQELGWSCQRPTRRALERNEKKIEGWQKKRWPKLKKKPRGRSER